MISCESQFSRHFTTMETGLVVILPLLRCVHVFSRNRSHCCFTTTTTTTTAISNIKKHHQSSGRLRHHGECWQPTPSVSATTSAPSSLPPPLPFTSLPPLPRTPTIPTSLLILPELE